MSAARVIAARFAGVPVAAILGTWDAVPLFRTNSMNYEGRLLVTG